MKPFRKNVAIAIDGGGIRGIIVTQALTILETFLNKPVHDIFRLVVGTSTGSIISAGIAAGITAKRMTQLYIDMGMSIFPNTIRKILFPLTRYRYSAEPLNDALNTQFGNMKMGEFWRTNPRTDLVITTYDLEENRTRFIKPWKNEYKDWKELIEKFDTVAKVDAAYDALRTYWDDLLCNISIIHAYKPAGGFSCIDIQYPSATGTVAQGVDLVGHNFRGTTKYFQLFVRIHNKRLESISAHRSNLERGPDKKAYD